MAASLMLLTGCQSGGSAGGMSDRWPESISASTIYASIPESSTEMPEIMPEDFNFSVNYGYGEHARNEVNTYLHTVTKDLVQKGESTIEFVFDRSDLEAIYAKMREVNVMGVMELEPPKSLDQNACVMTPSNQDKWKVTAAGETKEFVWTDKRCEVTEDAKRLLELRKDIHKMVSSTAAYQSMPEIEGGYD